MRVAVRSTSDDHVPPYSRRAELRDEEIREDLHVSSEGDMAAHARAQREIGEAD